MSQEKYIVNHWPSVLKHFKHFKQVKQILNKCNYILLTEKLL